MAFTALRPPPQGTRPVWWPLSAQQQAALESPAEMLLYGGASGGGKSDYLVADAMQEKDNPNLRALLLRKSYGDMGQLMDRMAAVYRPLGARWKGDTHEWIFPSGAKVRTGYMSGDADLEKYRGNPFSWLGVDEAGEQPEHRIRKPIAWLSTIDPRLRVRARFTANPGGIGHAWLMKVFLRGRCPVHFPGSEDEQHSERTSVWPGRVYEGSKWQTDGMELRKTVAFIPATVRDNPLYDQRKIDSLLSQTAEVQEHLLRGCWCKGEGTFFPFLRQDQVLPYEALDDQWWWTHFISIDYGYGNSAAAAGLYSVNEAGVVHKLAERVSRKMLSYDFAQMICDDWIEPQFAFPGERKTPQDLARLERWTTAMMQRPTQKERRKIVCIYMDPANDQHSGTGQSNMEIMADIFHKHGLVVAPAAKDPVGNAQQLGRQMMTKRFVLCDTAPQTYDSLASRVNDDKKAKVKKVHGDPLDDIYDETSYGINTWLQGAVKPEAVAVQEKLNEMSRRGVDERSLLIHRHRLEQTMRDRTKSVSVGRRGSGAKPGRR